MTATSMTQQLWLKARAGEAGAYDQLFGLQTDRLLLFIRARLGPALREKLDPEDVLQETYLAAHRDFAKFEYTDDGAFLKWLCRIVEHRLADLHDYHKAAKRQAVVVPRSAPSGPVTQLHRAEHRERVAIGLDRLSDEHRQVLLLRYFEGLTAEEAGQVMQRSAGAIRKLTVRALLELERVL